MNHIPKVLIVEDSDLQAEYLEMTLHNLGITDVTLAGDGRAGLECYERALRDGMPYHLLFIDIIMPEMDGQELLKRIRAIEAAAGLSATGRSVIIMTTALHSTDDMMESLVTGDCNDYIVKPVVQNDLRSMLGKYGVIG